MIFATVGHTHMPFTRLMDILSELPIEHELVVQHGPAAPPPNAAAAFDYLPFEEVLRYINEADVIVCHAGVGTVLCALRAGRTPIVVPRLKALSETVDDHQLEFTSALVDIGAVVSLNIGASLAELLASREQAPATSPLSTRMGLSTAVRTAILRSHEAPEPEAVGT